MSPLRSATPNKQFTGFPTQSQSVWNTFQVYLDTSFGPGNFFGQLFNNLQALELSLGVPCLLQEFYLCILFVHINFQVLELSLRVLGILRKAYLYVGTFVHIIWIQKLAGLRSQFRRAQNTLAILFFLVYQKFLYDNCYDYKQRHYT